MNEALANDLGRLIGRTVNKVDDAAECTCQGEPLDRRPVYHSDDCPRHSERLEAAAADKVAAVLAAVVEGVYDRCYTGDPDSPRRRGAIAAGLAAGERELGA